MAMSAILSAHLSGLGGVLLVIPPLLPVLGLLLAPILGGRLLGLFALVLMLTGFAASLAIATAVFTGGYALQYHLGGWSPPLGVALKADGLSAVMLLTAAVVILAVGIYAQRGFAVPPGATESRTSLAFWSLLMGIWAGLNTAFLSQDLFTLFVALELLTFSAVPLVCLDGRAETLAAALRYLLFALLGSALYLLGAVLFYGSYGTLDIALLAGRIAGARPTPLPVLAAATLMTVGLLAKTALFPLHLWLPPAHAGAPPAASAILSALVVKASFFLILRIWFDLMPVLLSLPAAQVLGILGGAAILFGNLVALRQARLKLLIAYSTLAQLGYLFLIFALAAGREPAADGSALALAAGTVQVVAHACAKAAMFMAAGLIAAALGHDRISGLSGIGRALPFTVVAFGLAGLSLIGLPPSGGYLVKTLLNVANTGTGHWWWDRVVQAGGLLTAAYLFRVLSHAWSGPRQAITLRQRPRPAQELVVLGLALCAVLLGMLPPSAFHLIDIGRPEAAAGAVTALLAEAWGPDKLWESLWPVAIVAAVVLGMRNRQRRLETIGATVPVGGAPRSFVMGRTLDRADSLLRQWPVAGLMLLVLIALLARTLSVRP